MRLAWTRKETQLEISGAAGWSYSSLSIERELQRLGAIDPDAEVAVHFGVAGIFRPVAGKRNVLFTMWESEWQGRDEILPVIDARKPDLVVTPCEWNTAMLRAARPDQPVATVPLGYDPDLMTYQRRRWAKTKSKFRILVLSAPNYRKYTVSREVYAGLRMMRERLLRTGIDVQFYWKLTGACPPEAAEKLLASGKVESPEADVFVGDDWVVDNRFLPRQRVAELYRTSHLYLALHGGEGFHLGCLEAAVSGCPIVVTGHSGPLQYLNERNAWLVPYDEQELLLETPGRPTMQRVIMPRLEDALSHVVAILGDYYAATERAKRAHHAVRGLTWRATALGLCKAVADSGMIDQVESPLPAASAA